MNLLRKINLMIVLLFANFAFAQELQSTNEPIQINYIEVDGNFLAKADVYADYVELHFYDSEILASISLALELEQFDQIAEVSTSYGKDTDLYKFDIPGAQFCVRFIDRNAKLYLLVGGGTVNFPELTKVQLRKLFKR
mgnify:CR=1 FL=1